MDDRKKQQTTWEVIYLPAVLWGYQLGDRQQSFNQAFCHARHRSRGWSTAASNVMGRQVA